MSSNLTHMARLLNVDPQNVLRRVGLSPALVNDTDATVDAQTYFDLWRALHAEANRPGMEMEIAKVYAHGPFFPPIFAFSCADTLALGIERLAVFKPLVGPLVMEVSRPNGAVRLVLRPNAPDLRMPSSLGLLEILYITECARTFTGTPLRPAAATLIAPTEVDQSCLDYLGLAPAPTGETSLTFAPEDAERALITRSASQWDALEPAFLEELRANTRNVSPSAQIKHALTEALPGGSSTIDDIARRLNVSKRSLQRRLADEGTTFQDVLRETRTELAKSSLRNSDLTIPEISHLLGFREMSSFFRAFQKWTGVTPGQYRAGDR